MDNKFQTSSASKVTEEVDRTPKSEPSSTDHTEELVQHKADERSAVDSYQGNSKSDCSEEIQHNKYVDGGENRKDEKLGKMTHEVEQIYAEIEIETSEEKNSSQEEKDAYEEYDSNQEQEGGSDECGIGPSYCDEEDYPFEDVCDELEDYDSYDTYYDSFY